MRKTGYRTSLFLCQSVKSLYKKCKIVVKSFTVFTQALIAYLLENPRITPAGLFFARQIVLKMRQLRCKSCFTCHCRLAMGKLRIKWSWIPALMNVIGLGIAFTVFLILMSQVWWDFTYDRFKGGKDVYIVDCLQERSLQS